MRDEGRLSRRAFLKVAALGSTITAFLSGCWPPHRSSRRTLNEDQAACLGAFADQIIPTDSWPGGKDAGVVDFIDIQLDGPYRRLKPEYERGLAAMTRTCVQKCGSRFESLPWEQQTSFLRDMEAGRLSDGDWKEGFASRFFEMVRSHCLQGYYGSPRHGGNRDFVSYRMIGLDEVQVVGQNRYRTPS